MRRITVTASTIGQANPSQVSESKPYRYRGDPEWVPGDARYKEDPAPGHAAGLTRERARRLEEFEKHLDRGLSVNQAGRELGIKPSTARHYERDLRDLKALRAQQQGETADA
jgi:hypothetical protein